MSYGLQAGYIIVLLVTGFYKDSRTDLMLQTFNFSLGLRQIGCAARSVIWQNGFQLSLEHLAVKVNATFALNFARNIPPAIFCYAHRQNVYFLWKETRQNTTSSKPCNIVGYVIIKRSFLSFPCKKRDNILQQAAESDVKTLSPFAG